LHLTCDTLVSSLCFHKCNLCRYVAVELKMKWQKVNEAYQKLPFNCDSAQQKFRKESLEAGTCTSCMQSSHS
jgi:hypothetical protein